MVAWLFSDPLLFFVIAPSRRHHVPFSPLEKVKWKRVSVGGIFNYVWKVCGKLCSYNCTLHVHAHTPRPRGYFKVKCFTDLSFII